MKRKQSVSQKELQIVLNLPSSTVSYNLKKLMNVGCIERSESESGQYEYAARGDVTPDGTT